MAEAIQDQKDEVALDTPAGKVKVRGSDMLGILTLVGVCVFGYVLWDHKSDSTQTRTEFVSAIKEMSEVNKQMVVAQRVQNCLLTVDQKERESKLPTCERIAR